MNETSISNADRITDAQTTEEKFLRKIFIRDQMSQFARDPLLMARADGGYYWDVHGKQYLDALSGIYVVNVGHNNRHVIEAIRQQMQTLSFSPVMHGSNPLAVRLANRLVELAPGDLSAVKLLSGGSEATEAAIAGNTRGPEMSNSGRGSTGWPRSRERKFSTTWL